MASAPGKYDRSRNRVAPAPGGNHCPTAPHGSARNSTGVAADAIGLAIRMKITAPSASPGRPMTDASPSTVAPTASSARPTAAALTRY